MNSPPLPSLALRRWPVGTSKPSFLSLARAAFRSAVSVPSTRSVRQGNSRPG